MRRERSALALLPGLDGTGYDAALAAVRVAARGRASAVARSLVWLIGRIRALLAANSIAAFARIRVPTMYVQGTHDTLLPASCVEEIRRLVPKTRVVKIAAPHCVLQCAPDEAARTISEFFRSI